jgi:hypothetical protein
VSLFVAQAFAYAHPSGSGCQVVLSCAKLDGRRTHCLHFHQAQFEGPTDRGAHKAETIVNITSTCAEGRPVGMHHLIQYVKDTDRQTRSMKTSTDDALAMSHTTSSSTERSLAERTGEVGENKELEDRLWEGDDDEDNDDDENPLS